MASLTPIRKLLSDKSDIIYTASLPVNNSGLSIMYCHSITICNTTDQPRKIFLVVDQKDLSNTLTGAIIYGETLKANETMAPLNIYLNPGDKIRAWSDVKEVVSFVGFAEPYK